MLLFFMHLRHSRTPNLRRQSAGNPRCGYSLLFSLNYRLNAGDVHLIIKNRLTEVVLAYIYTQEIHEFCSYIIQIPKPNQKCIQALEYILSHWNGTEMWNTSNYHFYIACYCGNISALELIYDRVKDHPSFDIHYNSDQPLRAAVILNRPAVIKFLLERSPFAHTVIKECIRDAKIYKYTEIIALLNSIQ